MLAGALSGFAVIHLVMLGVLGELVINTSDLTHTQMPEITKKRIVANNEETQKQTSIQDFDYELRAGKYKHTYP